MILKITECIYLYSIILCYIYYYAKFKYRYLIYNDIIRSVSSKIVLTFQVNQF